MYFKPFYMEGHCNSNQSIKEKNVCQVATRKNGGAPKPILLRAPKSQGLALLLTFY